MNDRECRGAIKPLTTYLNAPDRGEIQLMPGLGTAADRTKRLFVEQYCYFPDSSYASEIQFRHTIYRHHRINYVKSR